MYKALIKLGSVIVLGSALAACSSSMFAPSQSGGKTMASGEEKPIELSGAPVADTAPLAGNIEGSMDDNDRNKLSRALDAGIGKESRWVSSATGITYSVMPTRKISVGGNNLCRQYTITATRGSSRQQVSGSACVGSDGAWHTV